MNSNMIDIMEVKTFVNGKTFNEIKESSQDQNLRVRELSSQKDLYLLIADSEYDTPLHMQANGIILEKETNKIVCMCQNRFLPLSSPVEQFETLSKLYTDYSLEYCEDGTIIRLYNYNGTWITSTTKCIDAKFSYWKQRDLTFDSMFWNLFNSKMSLSELDPNYTYVFILLNQDNRIVVNHSSDSLIFVSKINNLDQSEISVSDDSMQSLKRPEIIKQNGQSLDSYFDETKRGLILKFKGDNKVILYKYDFKPYSRLKEVRGNVPLIRMRFLELLSDPKSIEMLEENYKEHTFLFQMAKHQLNNLYHEIHQLYFNSHIKHAITVEESHKFYRTLKQLHGQYKTTGRPITLDEVTTKVNCLDANVLRQFLNWV